MTTTAEARTTPPRLPIHDAVMAATGTQGLADLVRPLTDREERLVQDFLNRIHQPGSVDAQAQAFLIAGRTR